MADPIMGAEDFSYMLGVKQGAYIMLGANVLDSSTRCCTTLVTISMTRSFPPAPPTGPPWSNSN